MALIKCVECGREVSDRAQACPQCGSPMASENVTLHLKGFPRRYIGSGPVAVYLNGELQDSVEKGQTKTVVLQSGGEVEFRTHYMGVTRHQSFSISGGCTADLYFDFGPLGGLKVVEAGSGPTTIFGVVMDMPDGSD